MPLIGIHEAARRLGTTEDLIRYWLSQGLLKGYVPPQADSSANTAPYRRGGTQVATLTDADLMVDTEELDDVAETEGWLLIATDSLDEE